MGDYADEGFYGVRRKNLNLLLTFKKIHKFIKNLCYNGRNSMKGECYVWICRGEKIRTEDAGILQI